MSNTTPIVRCGGCDHPINDHIDSRRGEPSGCVNALCNCRVDPNTIANGAIYSALTAGLTPAPRPQRISRQPDGSWS